MTLRNSNRISRRAFAAGAAAAVFAPQFIPSRVLAGPQTPGSKLNIAGIGVGGMGGGNIGACGGENIVALCDVDQQYAGKTFSRYPKAKIYTDYRVMLDKQKDIEAVVIATPDHTHAVIAMAAMQAGKHVYCQKPLTHSVFEARKLTAAARQYKVQTQMGNQGHSFEEIRLLREWIEAGLIGDVREVHTWTDRPIGNQVWSNFAVQELPKGRRRCPARWIGISGWVRPGSGPISRFIVR